MRQESPDEQPKLVAYGEVMGVLSRSGLVIFDTKLLNFCLFRLTSKSL